MFDPRLNSVHLEMPRRQAFRQARDLLLGVRGNVTLDAEQRGGAIHSSSAIERFNGVDGPGVQLLLIEKEYVFPLHVGLNTLGRSSDNDIVLHDGYVSRRHCTIVVHSNRRVEVHDTASRNGTYINGLKLNCPARLKPGDEVRVCDCRMVFMARNDGSCDPPDSNTIRE